MGCEDFFMKTYFGWVVASAFVIGSVGSTFAADLPMKAAAPRSPVTTYTGCYLDVGAGYGMWNQDQLTETFPGLVPNTVATTTDGGRGWLGRFGGGCDYQLGGDLSNWVVGAFGDYDVMNIKGTNNLANVGAGGAFGPNGFAPEKERNAWYVGGRLGYLVTPALLTYASAGYTQTSFNQQNMTFLNGFGPLNAFLPATTYQGWFVGGGTEYAMNFSWLPAQGLFWRNEYRFASYGAKDLPLLGPGAGVGFGQHTTPSVQTITTSLVWKFNWGGPVVAKY
jgi:outer membrane immunogenic protein